MNVLKFRQFLLHASGFTASQCQASCMPKEVVIAGWPVFKKRCLLFGLNDGYRDSLGFPFLCSPRKFFSPAGMPNSRWLSLGGTGQLYPSL